MQWDSFYVFLGYRLYSRNIFLELIGFNDIIIIMILLIFRFFRYISFDSENFLFDSYFEKKVTRFWHLILFISPTLK